MEFLFVYGTLRAIDGHPMHNYLRSFCHFMGEASIGGIRVDLGDYPGLLPSGNPEHRVLGELYRIQEGASTPLFDALDRYEGCGPDDPEPHLFFRHRQDVTLLAEQQIIEAWVYFYNPT